MAQTFVRILVHLVFSTKHRKNLIVLEIEASLYAFEDELLQLLQRHHVSYDPRYIWD